MKLKLKFSKTLSQNQLIEFTARGGVLRSYYTKKAKDYIQKTKEEICQQYKGQPLCGECWITIIWKSQFYNKGNGGIKKIDIDNPLKALINCLTGLVLQDDNQIFKLKIEKVHIEKGEEVEMEIFFVNG